MSLLEKIKSIFRQKKVIEEHIIKKKEITDINLYLQSKGAEIESALKQKADAFYYELSNIIEEIEEDNKVFLSVDISQKKIEEKIKKITELGKKDYAADIERLLNKLTQKKEPELAVDFIKKELNEFFNYSQKSHFKATQLIGKEIEKITDNLIKIKSLVTEFEKNNQNLIESHNKIKALKQKNEAKIKNEAKKQDISNKIIELQQNNNQTQKRLEEIERETQEIKESHEFKERESLVKQKNKKESILKAIELEIKSLIDKKILEKYAYIEKDKENKRFIKNYIETPLKALMTDKNLKIINIWEDAKEKIKNKEITLKDSNKIMEKASIKEEVLINYKGDIIILNEEIETLAMQISNIKINEEELQNEKSKIESSLLQDKAHLSNLVKKQEQIEKEIFSLETELHQEAF